MKTKLWGLLILLILFVQGATVLAEELPYPLPDSTCYEGYVYYNKLIGSDDDGGIYLRGRIDFAVYDTEGGNEFEADYGVIGTGRYVYAYQIFNAPEDFSSPVATFAVLGVALGTVDGIGAQEDPEEGVEPYTSSYDEDESRVVWQFADGLYVYESENSWFLVFSSDQSWVPGSYYIAAPEGESDFPAPGVPEPATIALLGLGSVLMFGRRRGIAR